MNFKSLKVVLIVLSFCLSGQVFAEKIPESPKQKEIRIENDLNRLFREATITAAKKLDKTKQVEPFALVSKLDGTTGVYQADKTEKNAKLSVIEQVSAIRNVLVGLGHSKQINAYVQVMYAQVQQNKKNTQGLSVELEHIEGVSLMRFVPVTELKNELGELTGELQIELGQISTAKKPKVVFK